MNRVFVYGTLKRGQRNSHYLDEALFIGEFTTGKGYSMYRFDDYPAVCLDGGHAIQGEVYRLGDELLRVLDELEQYPDYYQRIEIDTLYGRAWMYVVTRQLCDGKQMIEGTWR